MKPHIFIQHPTEKLSPDFIFDTCWKCGKMRLNPEAKHTHCIKTENWTVEELKKRLG